ncbi:hypothetical protein DSOUD_2355 [Desulfuromonas soudanensis]|uniref:OmpA-like domain-containing protein n=1 Tax=Desulfuromonas soudanensis TaxID=1603606 RepID=A0A0M4CXT8_9BACT|nr:OmpA family protein [Desulfuromonas soudanensis]ALC17116.1 hypothetical protein DSOUD_2355 [Desulfuromonas soudanensis]
MIKTLTAALRTLFPRRLPAAGTGKLRPVASRASQQTAASPAGTCRPGARRSLGISFRNAQGRAILVLALTFCFATSALAVEIDNTATIRYAKGGPPITQASNTVTVVATPPPTVATGEFLRLTADAAGLLLSIPDFSPSDPPNGVYTPLLPPYSPGTLAAALRYAEEELVVFRIDDHDQNLDPTGIDTLLVRLTVTVSGESELLRLYEDSVNSGLFVGYIQAGADPVTTYNGYLTAPAGSTIALTYDDGGTPLSITAAVDGSAPLWLHLATSRSVVGQGDAVPLTLTVENLSTTATAPAVSIIQILPAGFRYQKGSARRDGRAIPDPLIAADGRTLTFPVGDLDAGGRGIIDFVAAVATAPPGSYPTPAQAFSGTDLRSNRPEVLLTVGDDFLSERSFLAGRVVQRSDCGASAQEIGVPGVRLYLEDGTFVITDSEGRYHIEGLSPGSHVIQLDPVTIPGDLEPALCEDHTRFAKTPTSRFIELQGGTLWLADFYLSEKRLTGTVNIALENQFDGDDRALYRVALSGRQVSLKNLKLHVSLPAGVTFIPGSAATAEGLKFADPDLGQGNELIFDLADPPTDWEKELRFAALLDNNALTREIQARAWLRFSTPKDKDLSTPTAECALIWIAASERREVKQLVLQPRFETLKADLTEADRREIAAIAADLRKLDLLRILVAGHTDARQIRWHEGVPFRDNAELSAARARAVADELAAQLPIDPEDIVVIGRGATEPVADNTSEAGRARNRRTDLYVLHRVAVPIAAEEISSNDGPEQSVATSAGGGRQNAPAIVPPPLGILSPGEGERLPHSVESVRVRIDARLEAQLTLDGRKIPASSIGFTQNEPASNTRLLTYIGVDFGAPGVHLLRLRCVDPFGNARFDQTVEISRIGAVHDIEVFDSSGNVADGRTPITLKLRLFDENGEAIEGTTQLELRSGTLIPLGSERHRSPRSPETTMVEIGRDGLVRFEPVNRAGRYRIVLGYGSEEEEIEFSVKPEVRDWIVVGLASGSAGTTRVSSQGEGLPAGVSGDDSIDGRLAFFASGQIKGDWLLTAAYDSEKESRQDRTLFQTIDPDSYFTLYGDATAQGYAAASAAKLFARIEREEFHATFGDIQAGLTKSELGRYNRSLTGFQSELDGERAGFSLFVSQTAQSFVRDELRGDGTSGLYRLSRTPLVINSEKLLLETRDRLHSERIVSTRTLQRHVDYDIDYTAGTLFFKFPVASKDEAFNPTYIVVDYETHSSDSRDTLYGGRGYLRFFEDRLEVGATLIHEGQGFNETDLLAADATVEITGQTVLRTEYATSQNSSPTVDTTANAWLAELRYGTEKLKSTLYLREKEEGFGLGQQNASEVGMRKYGLESNYAFDKAFDLAGDFSRQENFATGVTRDVGAGNLRYRAEKYSLSTGLRHAADQGTDGVSGTSDQILFGGDWRASKKLTLKTTHEQSIGKNDNTDYPTRTLIGADYALTRSVTLFGAQEYTSGSDGSSEGTRLGLLATPWDGGQIRSSVEQQLAEDSRRRFATLGYSQTWQVTPEWSLDGSVDRSQLLSGRSSRPLNDEQPAASQNEEDFTALSLGSNLRRTLWSWDNRFEFRTSDTEDRWGVQSGYIIEPRHGLGFSLHTGVRRADFSTGTTTSSAEMRFGLAWRPVTGRQILLNRLDLRSERQSGNGSDLESWRVIDNFKAAWRYGEKIHLAFLYGGKYVSESFGGGDFSGYTDLIGGEMRYDLTPRWDLGAHGKLLTSWTHNQRSSSTGIDLGFSPVKNLWLSAGYNLTGFTDKDFSAADYTAQGPFIRFRFKFDQNSVKDALTFLNRG